MTDAPQYTNRLIHETSPYLLQHAHNPVNWYPWGEEALARAKELDQPIFLSIGYAACHWCHVMERESFEDDDTAAELNARFVAIKVDREERPDLDSIYMDALQALTNQGGWPMSMFLTPEGLPFYGGTYFPDQPRHGMPAFRQVLARIAEVWADRREWIESTATQLAQRVRDEQDAPARLMAALAQLPEVAPAERLDDATRGLLKSFDPVNGGWGEAPKFPQAMSIELLLREHLRTGAKEPRLVAERTLDAMAAGGIYDHLGGGFARYSTDARWLVPHFEKMLYDNALLARAYAHAAELTGDPHYAYVARETLDFVAHEMRNPAGGAFAASLDADTDGTEGATYTWDAAEVRTILGDAAPLFEAAYDVTDEGNWEGHTILNRVRTDTELAVEHERPRDEIAESLAQARTELLRVRDERPQPARDDKVLTAWNGLMIAAFADAGRVAGRARLRARRHRSRRLRPGRAACARTGARRGADRNGGRGMSQATELIVSIHVPKTGGETFRDILEELTEGHLQRDYGDRPLAPMSVRQRLRLATARPHLEPGTRAVHGHFIATKYWRRYPDARYMAWFREPVERLASHYYYWKRKPDRKNPTCQRLIEEDLSLEAFAALPEMRDVQARFLGEVPPERLAFVGITERYDESIDLFRQAFYPALPATAERTNANPERGRDGYDLEPSVRATIEALNSADVALYEAATDRFEVLLAEHAVAVA